MTKLILFSFLTLLSAQVFAGDKVLNGGDICEDRIKIIRDDLRTWINQGGSKGLNLPAQVSLIKYNASMPAHIARATVQCTDKRIQVSNTEKICANRITARGQEQILCNRKALLNLSDEAQYILIHHEYAGLSGFESNVGAESFYPLSNQLSAYLEQVVVTRLTIKMHAVQKIDDTVKNFGEFAGHYKVKGCSFRQGDEPENARCRSFYYADVFFGADYKPKQGSTDLFLKFTDASGNFMFSGQIAADGVVRDRNCTDSRGFRLCTGFKEIFGISFREIGGLIRMDNYWLSETGFLTTINVDLEKISDMPVSPTP